MAMLRRTALTLTRIINSTIAPQSLAATSISTPNLFTEQTLKLCLRVCHLLVAYLVCVVCRLLRIPVGLSRAHLRKSQVRLYSTEYDFSDAEGRRRILNRLLYRSKQRGLLELDLVLGKWVEANIDSMDESGIKSLIQVLDLENPDLWRWLSGQEQPPESVINNPVFAAIQNKVATNLNSYAAPETRAIPGQPWVRGWDDIKKAKDSPVSGNQ